MEQPRIYFPNLNGLRFIAALLVIIHHVEAYKGFFRMEHDDIPFATIAGPLGVILFFVLSGFLITYLLLFEETAFGKINIRNFYTRRILRIWPLYFLILLLAFLVLPNIDIFVLPRFGKDAIYSQLALKIIFYVFFLPNLACAALSSIPYASHTWSIGTEEQFYLVWPLLLRFFKKYRMAMMLGIILCYNIILALLKSPWSDDLPGSLVLRLFWPGFSIDCMAIGGILALLYFRKSRMLSLLMDNRVFYVVLMATIFLLAMGYHFPYLHDKIYAVLFGIIVLNLAANDTLSISLENNILNYLGRISYGLYMYHPIAIVLAFAICRNTGHFSNWFIYPLAMVLTSAMAALSYQYFESWFLKRKQQFTEIISGKEKPVN
ncbi:hypothetical protein HYN49_10235 [Flavobacterium pallidum]|uniref:Acyltransferase 3 domain-containing protein n=2 Tax=Flavobacterium pallidum TaxID=2172098 RepID=A0A2S1SIS9_9FLAO|nr:hypothetical protein HYN49_10235 [Flavobacterium pallidum]